MDGAYILGDSEKQRPHSDLSGDDLERLIDSHPILEREYILPTPMMKNAYDIIRDRVWARRTGLVFYAAPRTGKTKCATAASGILMDEFPKLHVSRVNARRSTRATDTHMLRLMLEAEQHKLADRANADKLFNNVFADIEVKTKTKGGNQFVLMIDEMQLLNDTDLQQLVSVHNGLEALGIKMTTISFAQPEILHRRTALLASNDRQIIARFLSELVSYSGVADFVNLKRILTSYDEDSEYPEDSGWSYTRFFLPKAFDHGCRLAKYASMLWEHLATAANIGGGGAVPMEHICLSIEFLLLSLRKQDCTNLVLSNDEIANAVASSGLQNFCSVINDGE